MMFKKTMILISAFAVSSALLLASPANAGGLLADIFVKPFCPNCAEQLDDWHSRAGNPLDHLAAPAAEALIPGSGAAVRGIQEFNRLKHSFPSGPQGGIPPAMHGLNGPMGGNFCLTPVGRFGPGPTLPVGAPCHAMTHVGPVPGRISR